MGLDVRTMMVMTALLALLLSGLLALASLHAENIRGFRHWALAEFCIGLGLGLAFAQPQPEGAAGFLVLGAFLLTTGMNLQLVGIQAFRGWRINWRPMTVTLVISVISNAWFSFHHHDVESRAIVNSLLFAVINALSARALLQPDDPVMRPAYRFVAATFMLIALLAVARAVFVVQLPPGGYGLYAPIPVNPITFFLGSVLQLVVTFGFMLMMHYRIANALQRLAARDGLTGAFNRRSLEEQFELLRALYMRSGGTLSVMMIDIDHFKAVNDRYGHLAGDEGLRRLAALGEATMRRQDYFARYGGEEFCILLPATTEAEACLLAERLRCTYAELRMEYEDAVWMGTVSIGVADSTRVGLEFDQLVAAADAALYQAKHSGRNRVVAFSRMA